MIHTVCCTPSEVKSYIGWPFGDLIDDLVDLGAGAISQEDGAGISIAAVDMLAAVLFFIGAGQLVLRMTLLK